MSGQSGASTRWFWARCLATLCLAGFGRSPALAGEFVYGVGYSQTYDSNITRVPDNPIAEWTASTFVVLDYRENIGSNVRFSAQVGGNNYLLNTYSTETVFSINGAALWTISPQQLSWSLEDVARQVRLDISAPDTPSNRTNANSLSTGPNFTLRLDPANIAEIGARYLRFDIDGPGDSESYLVRVRWVHPVSELTKLSLNYEATRSNYKDPGSLGNNLQERRFVRFEKNLPLGGVAVDAGSARVSRERADELNSRFARLTLSSKRTSESSLSVSLASQFSDTGSELLGGVTSPAQSSAIAPSTPSTVVATRDVYHVKRGDVAYENGSRPFGFALRGYASRFDYEGPNKDFDERGGRISCTWRYPDRTIGAYVEILRRTLVDSSQQDTLRTSGVSTGYNLTPNVKITLEAARFVQSSSAPLNNFVDQRLIITLAYTSVSGPLGR